MTLQPMMRDALLAAINTPNHSLRRGPGGFLALGTPIRKSGAVSVPAFTRRTVNRLDNAGLVTFDDPDFPSCVTLTQAGIDAAKQIQSATLARHDGGAE